MLVFGWQQQQAQEQQAYYGNNSIFKKKVQLKIVMASKANSAYVNILTKSPSKDSPTDFSCIKPYTRSVQALSNGSY